jgi:hypothetical protein
MPVTEWRRHLRPLLATVALAYLLVMVVSGAMPVQRQLVRFLPRWRLPTFSPWW